jgi:hypothetical protein
MPFDKKISYSYLHDLNVMSFDVVAKILVRGINDRGPDFFENWIERCEWLECDERKENGNCDHRSEELIDILYNIFDNAFYCAKNSLWNTYNAFAVVTESSFDFVNAKITMQRNLFDKYEVSLTTSPSAMIGFGREL